MDLSKTIETNRLTLRNLNRDDYEFFLGITNDKAISENINYLLEDVDLSKPELLFKIITNSFEFSYPFLSLIILRKDTKDCIGLCGLRFLIENKEAICFYYLIPLYRDSGFAIESLKKLIAYGFSRVNLNKISIYINPKSKSIWKVAERSGLKYLGHVHITEINSKAMYFSIEKEEFRAQEFI
jgi:ribosomal-protein-alanine N-acetyltransferase